MGPKSNPEERAAALMAGAGPQIQALIREAVKLAVNPRGLSPADRADALMTVSENLSRTIVPYTPCVKGCSHCCYMATCISGHEARMIGRYLGRDPKRLGRENVFSDSLQEYLLATFTGVPCSLLDERGKCSVYPVRPIACRLHHSLEPTEENCKIVPGVPITVAHINLTVVDVAHASLFAADDFGDIREFFPTEPEA